MTQVFSRITRSRVAIEVGTHSPRMSRLLRGLGHEVIVANARQVKLISASSRKDDRLDAQTHLLHHVGGSYSFPAGCNCENGLVTRFLSA